MLGVGGCVHGVPGQSRLERNTKPGTCGWVRNDLTDDGVNHGNAVGSCSTVPILGWQARNHRDSNACFELFESAYQQISKKSTLTQVSVEVLLASVAV